MAAPEGKIIALGSASTYFLSLPWSDSLKTSPSLQECAARAMEDVYGAHRQAWRVAVADESYGKARLACAVEAKWLDSLLLHCRGADMAVAAVVPAVQAAYMALRRQLEGDKGIFILLEPGCLAILRWEQGIAVDVEVMPRQADVLAQARDAVARLALQVGEVGGVFLAFMRDEGTLHLPSGWQGLGWPAQPLPGFGGAWLLPEVGA